MRQFRLITLISSLVLLPGCFQTKLNAPLGREVRLLAQDEPVKFRTEYKNWYVLYGFVPIWTRQPEEIIRKENLAEVRAQTQDTVSDAIITTVSMLLPIMIFPQHVIVEGNRKSDLPPKPSAELQGAAQKRPETPNQPENVTDDPSALRRERGGETHLPPH